MAVTRDGSAAVGFGGLTVIATDACYSVAAPLEALHTCTFVGTAGATLTGAAGVVTVEAARR